MEGEGPVFLRSLQGTFVDFLLFCEGEFFLLVVKMIAVGAGRSRGNQRFMVTEDGFIIEIKVVISDLRTGLEAFSEAVVEGCIEVIISFSNLYDIPGMRYLMPFSGLFPHRAIMHQIPRASQRILTDLAIPSQTPTPCPRGPMISWEYGFFSLS